MVKKNLLILFFLAEAMLTAQVPQNYYETAEGLTGYQLKTELHNIISAGHRPRSYGAIWTAFQTTDDDQYYENDGSVLDIYSENPKSNDPYEFTFVKEQCGNYSEESDCYNREHLMPKSWFDEKRPMGTDIHHIYPADGYVNAIRGHLPFGEVEKANYISENGSKRGHNVLKGYKGMVFEPIDAFKGDIARVYFYMATRYKNIIGSWENANNGSKPTFDGSSNQVFEDWVVKMLLKWHQNDPVSQREIDRNNDVYNFQGNVNPFIDHPEYASMIWGNGKTTVFLDKQKKALEMYTKPASDNTLSFRFSPKRKISIYTVFGEKILEKTVKKEAVQFHIPGLKSGLYFVKIKHQGTLRVSKLILK